MSEQVERRTLTMRFECRTSQDGKGLDITGRAVPFGDVINIGWAGTETFDRDCVFDGLDSVKLTLDHDHVIGLATGFDQRDDGLWMDAHISDTAEGRDIAQLMRDGAIDSMSVGFIPNEDKIDRDGLIHRRRVTLMEVAVTGMPAYKNATIT
ncbi:HK97 family phage prohead protease, partial [Bifidobacterium phasiani]